MRDKPFKQVIIFGPDDEGAFHNGRLIIPKDDDCLIIGDGVRDVTLEEIKQKITANINEATRIDVCTHGDIDSLDPTGTHYLKLNKDQTYTSELFKLFNQANNGKPIYTHLWACYSDNADKEFCYLPEGSLAVFHSSKNSYTLNEFSNNWLSYYEYNNTKEGAKKNLSANITELIVLGGTVKFSESGNQYAVKYVLPEIRQANTGYLDFIYEYFHKEKNVILVQATDDIEHDTKKIISILSKICQTEIVNPSVTDNLKEIRDFCRLRILVGHDRYIYLKSYLQTQNVNVNSCDGFHNTVLSSVKNINTLQLLIDNGANLNHQNKEGQTPLMHALIKNNFEVAITLLEHKANLHLEDKDGLTAIFYAVIMFEDKGLLQYHKLMLQFIINMGANFNHQNKKGETPLMVAFTSNKIEAITTLLAAGANPFIKFKDTNRTIYSSLLDQHTDISKKIEERILEQKNPLQYLVTCHESKSDLLKTLEQIKNSNLYIYQEIGILKIKRYLNETTIIGQHPVSNFRKLIKEQNLDALKLALEYDPIVTSKDIEMATKIFGNQLPATTLEAMQKLADKQQIQHESNHTSKLKDKNSQPRNKYR